MGSREGWMTLGQGLIGIGQNYQDINNLDITSRREELAEFTKQKRLARTDMMTNLNAAEDRKLKRDQFAADEAYRDKDFGLRERQVEATIDSTRSRDALAEVIQKGNLAVAERQAAVAEGKLELEGKTWEDRLEIMRSTENRAEADQVHRHAIDNARLAISEGQLEIAQKEIQLAKEHQDFVQDLEERKFTQSENAFAHDKDIAEKNLEIRQQELKLKQKQLRNSNLNEQDRIILQQDAQKLKEDIFEWEKENKKLDDQIKQAEINYKKAATASVLAETERENRDSKWVIKTQTVDLIVGYEDDLNNTPIIQSEQRLVAINVENPDLKEIKVLRPDGTWLNGTPDGLQHHTTAAITAINQLMRSDPGLTVKEAIAKAKTIQPDYDYWDEVGNLFLGVEKSLGEIEGPTTAVPDGPPVEAEEMTTPSRTPGLIDDVPPGLTAAQEQAYRDMRAAEAGGGW